jgi:hypothetical protein
MTLLLDVLNDNFELDAERGHPVWTELHAWLKRNAVLHREQIECWAQPGEPLDDNFAISGLLLPS